MKETISRLIKGKQGLDQVLSILVNFQKEGLGYTLNQKNAPKIKNPISFVKATNSPSTSQPHVSSNKSFWVAWKTGLFTYLCGIWFNEYL